MSLYHILRGGWFSHSGSQIVLKYSIAKTWQKYVYFEINFCCICISNTVKFVFGI